MTAPAVKFPKRISFEEFLAAIDEDTNAEWVDGEVVPVNPPSKEHIRITNVLSAALRGYVIRKRIGGVVLHAPLQMRLESSSRQPDVIFIRQENLHRWGEQFVDGPADLAIEVLSPDSRARDRSEKFREYAKAGVPEYWLIDPRQRSAEVYRLSGKGVYERVPPGEPPLLRSEVIPGLWIDPEWLWSPTADEWLAFEEWGLI